MAAATADAERHYSAVGQRAMPEIMRAAREPDPGTALFHAMDEGLAQSPGHRLLTVLIYFRDRGESQRAYSSRPVEYPIGGRKTLGQAPRMREVLASGEAFFGRTRQDVIDKFPDHRKLLGMGCESIINMPVFWGARVLGTVNLLHGEGHFAEADLPVIEAWAQLAAPAFVAAHLAR
ncbi:GAF domain-containing protein [Variovorax paradoxus]|nr:GAF domain-containing protein [Variovorax paradoxus]